MKNFFKAICRGIVKGAIIAYCKIVYRMKVVGKENIPQKGPIIICGNHRSFLDPPLIEVTCGRYSRFLAKEELTKNKFLEYENRSLIRKHHKISSTGHSDCFQSSRERKKD